MIFAKSVVLDRLRANLKTTGLAVDDTPTLPAPAPLLGGLSAVALTLPFNLLGWPAVSVPVGQNGAGLPIGLQLAGKPWDEATVLRAAYALEQAQGGG